MGEVGRQVTSAILRLPAETCGDGLTTANLGRPDYQRLLAQHEAYRSAFHDLGIDTVLLPAEPAYPDSYFVEDAAVVLPEVAIITRPGADSRRGEAALIEPVVARYRPLERIDPPGALEGGDVLVVGKQIFVGLSERSNRAGFDQFAGIVSRCGYACTPINVQAGLHLKSSLNALSEDTLLVSEDFAGLECLASYRRVVVHADESYACNVLRINKRLLIPAGFPGVKQELESLGFHLIELDMSEVQKMDGGLTCLSLRLTS
jgi:dimethylargininase